MATRTKPRYVDTSNPALAIDCPRCGLLTPRFLAYCRNCGYALWPSGPVASAAFKAWRDAGADRRDARRYDLTLQTEPSGPRVVDYEARAHELGIHIFPSSSYPFLICVGFFFMAFAAVPFNSTIRLIMGIVGGLVFVVGVVGWVVLEDVRMYPAETDLAAPGVRGGPAPARERGAHESPAGREEDRH